MIIKGFNYPEIEPYFGVGKDKINTLSVSRGIQALQILSNKSREEVAYVEVEPRAKYVIKENKLNLDDYAFIDFSKVIKPISIHLMLSTDFPQEDLNTLNKYIAELKANKTIDTILKKYRFPAN